MKNPRTLEEWQEVVDAAAALRVIGDCMMYGLLKGPKINLRRCDEILRRGRAKGIVPSKPDVALALRYIAAINAEAEDREKKIEVKA